MVFRAIGALTTAPQNFHTGDVSQLWKTKIAVDEENCGTVHCCVLFLYML
jgi:hypothetical protein